MSEQWYCPNCGLVEIKEQPYPQCVICASPSITLTIPPFVLAMQESIAGLEKKVDILESLEVKYIEEIQELHDRITDLKADLKAI